MACKGERLRRASHRFQTLPHDVVEGPEMMSRGKNPFDEFPEDLRGTAVLIGRMRLCTAEDLAPVSFVMIQRRGVAADECRMKIENLQTGRKERCRNRLQ